MFEMTRTASKEPFTGVDFVSILSNLENVTAPGAVKSYQRPIVRVKTITIHWTPHGRATFCLRILTQ